MRILILGGTGGGERPRPRPSPAMPASPSRCRWPAAPRAPTVEAVPTRVGGFGGAEGLARYLREEAVDRLVDATHPFAARISAGTPPTPRRRPGCRSWRSAARPGPRAPGDLWTEVETIADASRPSARRPGASS